jgi:hypothetical protein
MTKKEGKLIVRIFAADLGRGLARVLRHLFTAVVLQVLFVVVVGRHLNQPGVLDLDDLPHVLLGGEDELVVDEPPGQGLEQTTVGVDVHGLLVLGCFVRAGLAQLRCVVEESGSDGLAFINETI